MWRLIAVVFIGLSLCGCATWGSLPEKVSVRDIPVRVEEPPMAVRTAGSLSPDWIGAVNYFIVVPDRKDSLGEPLRTVATRHQDCVEAEYDADGELLKVIRVTIKSKVVTTSEEFYEVKCKPQPEG